MKYDRQKNMSTFIPLSKMIDVTVTGYNSKAVLLDVLSVLSNWTEIYDI